MVEYEIFVKDMRTGKVKKLNGLKAFCEAMWDVCFAIGVDCGDSKDPKAKELYKVTGKVCSWVSRLMDIIEKDEKENANDKR